MRRAKRAAIVAIVLVLVAGVLIYSARRSESAVTIVGVVRATEVRVEPEVDGQLVSIAVEKGAHVHAGDVVARLSAVELMSQADQARAAFASATATGNNVDAGVRREQVDSLKAGIAKANARLEYVQAQLTRTSTLARESFESQQTLDQAENDAASARADVAEAQANYDAAMAGPTREERAIADTQVQAAAAAVAVLERRLEKMILRAPADGVVSVIVAEGWREYSRRSANPDGRGGRRAMALVQCTGRPSQPSHDRRNSERDAERCRWRDQSRHHRTAPARNVRYVAGRAGYWGS
jgi:HlyD family secretion protein